MVMEALNPSNREPTYKTVNKYWLEWFNHHLHNTIAVSWQKRFLKMGQDFLKSEKEGNPKYELYNEIHKWVNNKTYTKKKSKSWKNYI
jgi:hypothetical protein